MIKVVVGALKNPGNTIKATIVALSLSKEVVLHSALPTTISPYLPTYPSTSNPLRYSIQFNFFFGEVLVIWVARSLSLFLVSKLGGCFYCNFSSIHQSLVFGAFCSDQKITKMAEQVVHPNEEVVVGEEINHARVITLNRPRQLNVISSQVVSLLAGYLEKWEKDDNGKLVMIKGTGRAFSAGGDLKMFYDGRASRDSCLEVVYRMYWLCYHIHTYKKPIVALVHGMSIGGGASLMAPMKFSVVTEKTVFSVPEASVGFHTDCGFSYMLPRLPGYLGEFLALTGARLSGKELVSIGLATHFVPSEKFAELEKRLTSLNSGEEDAVKSVIEEFATSVQIDEESILNKQSTINECFSKDSVEEIIKSFEIEASKEGNSWIGSHLKAIKRSSPSGLKITLKSIREGRKQKLAECLKKEFRLTTNILRASISGDVYEGIRALLVDKDNAPKWDPPTLDAVEEEKVDLVFEPFGEDLELQIPETEESRWAGKYENSAYAN